MCFNKTIWSIQKFVYFDKYGPMVPTEISLV